MTWDGTERRTPRETGSEIREGRRVTDWHCADHTMIQETTKIHLENVCGKIKELKRTNGTDSKTIWDAIGKKLDKWIFVWLGGGFVAVLILLSGYLGNKMDSGFSTLHTRITATQSKMDVNSDIRIKADAEQLSISRNIEAELGIIKYRLGKIEEVKK